MDFQLFEKCILAIQQQMSDNDQVSKILECDFDAGSVTLDALVDVLIDLFHDDDGWIPYYLFYYGGIFQELPTINGKEYPFETPQDLYDFLEVVYAV